MLDGREPDPHLAGHVQHCPACQASLDTLTADPAVVPGTPRPAADRFCPPPAFFARLLDTPPAAPVRTADADPFDLPTLPGFTVRRVLGRGGMGVVYEAVQESLHRVVAVKMSHAGRDVTPAERDRFRREAEAVARLHHPNVIPVHEVGEAGGRLYLVMEYAGGPSLADQLLGDPWPAREAATLVAVLAAAAQAAHDHGVVHRDLKPANILFTADGVAKVADFGLAKVLDGPPDGATVGGQVLGTPSYAAPEQLATAGAADPPAAPAPAADVYSLGAILYELLTGRPPFRSARPVDTLLQALHQDPIPPTRLEPRVPRDLETVCLKCLHKSPGRRYESAGRLADDLRRFLDGRPILARPAPWREKLWKWCRRNPLPAAALLGLAAAAAVAGGSLVWLWREAEDRAGLEAHARRETERRADAEARALRDATRRNAELRIDQLLAMCEQGEVARGMQGLAQAHDELADPDLRRLVRLNLSAWRYRLATQAHALPHPSVVRHLAFTPDGRTLVTGAQKQVRAWDVATGRPLFDPLGHDRGVRGVAVSPDGAVAASWADAGPARLWDPLTGRPVGPPADPAAPGGAAVTALAFAPDGRFVVTGSADGAVRLAPAPGRDGAGWEAAAGGPVRSVAVSPDGRRVLSGRADGVCRMWDAETGLAPHDPFEAGGDLHSVRFDPTGRFAAVGTAGGDTHLLRLDDGFRPHRVLNPRLPFRTLAFAARSSVLGIGVGEDKPNRPGACVLWDAASGRRLCTLDHDGPVSALVLSPDADRALVGGGHRRASLWFGLPDRPTQVRLGNAGLVRALALSPDGRVAAVGRDDTGWAKDAAERVTLVWSLPPDQRTGRVLPHPAANVIAADPAGAVAVTGDRDGRVRVWDLATGRPVGEGCTLPGSVEAVAFHPGGRRALVAAGPAVYPLDLLTGEVDRSAAVRFPLLVRCVRYSPDGGRFAAGGNWKGVEVWDAAAARRVGDPIDVPEQVVELGFTAAGLVVVGTGGTVQVRDPDTLALRWARRLPQGAHSAAVSPDGRALAVGRQDRTVRVVPLAPRGAEGPAHVMPDVVHRVGWCPDGRVVLAASQDGTARLLDVATGKPVGPPLPQRVSAAAVLPDGRSVLAGGPVQPVTGWAVPEAVPDDVRDLPAWYRGLNRVR
jgi:WD40 repeat protein/predicted Ser/Thr protein kinase